MIRHKASDETILLRFSHNQENHQKTRTCVKDDVGLRSIRGCQKAFYEVVAQVLSFSDLDLGGPDDLRCDLRFRKRPKIEMGTCMHNMEANIVASIRLMTFKFSKIEKAIQISNRINKIQHEHMFWFLI